MKKWFVVLAALLLALVAALPSLAGERNEEFQIEVFDYPGAELTNLREINNRGEITGIYVKDGVFGSFVYYKDEFTPVEVPGAVSTSVTGNNDRGDVVGTFLNADSPPHQLGFWMTRKGNVTVIEVPDAVWTTALDVNNRGTVVGFYGDGGWYPRGFIYEDGEYRFPIDIAAPGIDGAPHSTWLQGINNQGQIAGVATDYTTYSGAFIMEPDGSLTWPEPVVPGYPTPGRGFFDLNDHAQAVGTVITEGATVYTAWLWDRGETVLFDNIPNA